MERFFSAISERPLVFDGAMGTMIQRQGLTPQDFGRHPGVHEVLNLTRPDVIESIHRAYLEAGADAIITNTFGASRITLAEHGLGESVRDINVAAVRAARRAADVAGGNAYVVGELGPTSKLPSLGHLSFLEMERAYAEQGAALMEGGVDAIIISTSQDPLQAKAALSGAGAAMEGAGRALPLIVSVTVEAAGTMLVGTTLAAALASIEPYQPIAFGINCAVGPDLMEEHLAELTHLSPFPIICQPNAGLPENRGGKPYYPLAPREFAATMSTLVKTLGVRLVGGCCGTTPQHIAALARAVRGSTVSRTRPVYQPHCASLYSAVSFDQEPKPLIIAEQTNANGSRKFRELVAACDWDGCVAHARQAAQGAHVLDLCLALPGSDEVQAMHQLVPRLMKAVDRPLMIDSTSVEAIEAALSHIGGRAIINSINLEDGGDKAGRVIELAKRFGAALVCLTIDEDGMATDAERKVGIAKRMTDLAVKKGLRVCDLFIDPLVFTLASGDASTANAARETIAAIGRIKSEISGSRVSLGVSNVSFGLLPLGRKALTSYFLHRAIAAGADAAIVNARAIMPVDRIDPSLLPWIERLVDNEGSAGNPLTCLMEALALMRGEEVSAAKVPAPRSPIEALRQKVIDGDRSDLGAVIERALEEMDARAVVNDVLMPAMKVVGERFGGGTMPLPFVLQAAETMRAAVDLLSPHLKSDEAHRRGTIVLATVRGDVHDIGKNLVDAILSNNGFRVINLGIRQPATKVMDAVRTYGAHAVGLSGLLVSSTEVMREDLEVFRHSGLSVPVLCGGAALTEKFTREKLVPAYDADVYYCADAFDGLRRMETICKRHS